MKLKIGFKSNSALINSLFGVKLFYIFFSEYVYGLLVKLGDTPRYLSASFDPSLKLLVSSTHFMDFTGAIAGILPAPLYHIPFALISFYGVVYLIRTLSSFNLLNTYWDRVLFFLILSLPSTGVWSSIHSKESVAVFFMSILVSYIIRASLTNEFKAKWIELASMYLCLLFKPQYAIAIISVYSYIYIVRKSGLKPLGQFALFVCMITVQVYLLYFISDIINLYAKGMYAHFDSAEANSTRENIFISDYDFFRYAPSGMFIAFWGPTLAEVVSKPIQGIAFIESFILVCLFFLLLLRASRGVVYGRFNIFAFSVFAFTFFWLLFLHYPFGVFNPGSGIRYRTNFISFLLGVLFFIANYKRKAGKIHDGH